MADYGEACEVNGESKKTEGLEVEMEVDVAIVGAGMAGLGLAVGLRERGIRAHVFEKAAALRSDTATGISVALNGIHALDGIKPGLSVAMRSVGSDIKSIQGYFFNEGKESLVRTTKVEHGQLFVVQWKRAQQILANLIPEDHIHLSHRLLMYEPVGDWIEALFDVKSESSIAFSGLKLVRAKLLVGADGIWSAVRKKMVGDEPRDLQLVNWNALIYNPESKFIKAHEKDQIVHMGELDSPTKAYLVDAGEGYTFWVFRVEDHNEDGSEGGFCKDGAKDRALQKLANFEPSECWNTLISTIQATAPDLIFERRIRDRLPLESWTDATGRVLLIGDACWQLPMPCIGDQGKEQGQHLKMHINYQSF
ncbi:hypothetical protein O6H91_Y142700 [Diphasiastrum complanatum]|nr:hypothetical protein O6H91_Y142700 [Diphasiastrum complanatum]